MLVTSEQEVKVIKKQTEEEGKEQAVTAITIQDTKEIERLTEEINKLNDEKEKTAEETSKLREQLDTEKEKVLKVEEENSQLGKERTRFEKHAMESKQVRHIEMKVRQLIESRLKFSLMQHSMLVLQPFYVCLIILNINFELNSPFLQKTGNT